MDLHLVVDYIIIAIIVTISTLIYFIHSVRQVEKHFQKASGTLKIKIVLQLAILAIVIGLLWLPVIIAKILESIVDKVTGKIKDNLMFDLKIKK